MANTTVACTNINLLKESQIPASPSQNELYAVELDGKPATESQLNQKADLDLSNVSSNIDYIVESKMPTSNDPTWYRVYKSGWVEQGGKYQSTNNIYQTYNLLVSMADNNYTLVCTYQDVAASDSSIRGLNTGAFTTTTFEVKNGVNGANVMFNWQVSGMKANG